ncbi:MAG: ABC transporter ATP-binding protein [Clostridia bacterium]|nr:ABC transporter ATP-binding protein [Clostridia bacterium]
MAGRSLENLQQRYSHSAPDKKRGGMGFGPRRGPGGRGDGAKPKDAKNTIGRLLKYIGGYHLHLILVLLCMACSTVTSLVGAYMLRPVINTAADASIPAAERIANLGGIVLTMAGLYALGILSHYMQAKLMMIVSQNSIEKLRNDLFDKMQGLPVRFFDSRSTGEVMSRYTNDVDNIQMMLNSTMTSLISGVCTIIGTLFFMFFTNVWLSLLVIVFVPLFLKLGTSISKRSRKYYTAQQAALGAVNGYIEESITGQKIVKVFNHEEVCVDEFKTLNGDMRSKQLKAQFFGGIMGPIVGNTSQISYAFTAGIGGLLCIHAGFDAGGLGIFVNYARQFARPINNLTMEASTVFSALAGAERVFAVMDHPAELQLAGEDAADQTPETIKGHVILDDVTFGYVPDKTVLHNISLYAKPGQKIAFVGSTGAGKTTITNLLNRFYEIESGTITVDGIDIRNIRKDVLRQNVTMVLQDTHLFTGTVRENIRYGRLDATDEEVVQAAKTASAHSFIMRLENGYDTILQGDGANLSQGQRQLLNIARAALSKAPILVLDEATSSVDTRTERHIEKGMDRLMADRTTFIIAHRLSTVRNCNAIMVLEQGRIVERGDHDQLLAMKGRYYELYTGVKELD